MEKVLGMDLGDKVHVVVVFDEEGREVRVARVANKAREVEKFFRVYAGAAVVMEAGTHSGWISRLLVGMGHRVLVGNPRKLRVIWDAPDKSDERDARMLGLVYRLEPRLLHEVFHRSARGQADLEWVKARAQLVACRNKLINHVRMVAKGMGERLPGSSTASFHKVAEAALPEDLRERLDPLMGCVKQLTAAIGEQDRQIGRACARRYPETERLRQVPGVGPVTALAYVLTLEEPGRFPKSRMVGAFLGLTPKRDQSGSSDKQLGITKAGHTYLRQLLVSCAHYILGPFGPPSDLRAYGERIAARGGKNARKRAVVAVARKLAVLLHRLWKDGADYVAVRQVQEDVA